jgi:hypothetical protein
MRMANHLLFSPLHLIRSEPGQKEEAKPWGKALRERSQGYSAMDAREVASLPSRMGSPVGQVQGRVSPFRTKSVFSALICRRRSLAAACSVSGWPLALVIHAVTSSKRNVHLTDEVPRRPEVSAQVTPGHKSHTKGLDHASEAGTASPRPRPKGCQQRQSKSTGDWTARRLGSERQNLSVSHQAGQDMGQVSPAAQATKWPERTSSSQPATLLRNRPQYLFSQGAAIRQR